MPTCSRQTLVKDHAFLVKLAYYLKSLCGVRGFVSETFLLHKNMCDKMIVSRFASKNALSPISCGFEANIFMASKRVHFALQHFLTH